MDRGFLKLAAGAPLALLLLACPLPAQSAFQHVIQEAQAGRFPEAEALALALADPVERAQGRLYVRHQGGDLEGALRAAREGLEDHPSDPWMLEQAAFVSLSLGSGEGAVDFARRLAVAATEGGDSAQLERARGLEADARALLDRRSARGSALRGALALVAATILASAIVFGLLLRAPAADAD